MVIWFINPIRHGGGHFVPGSFSYCDIQKFSKATMSSIFFYFSYNYITFMITTKKGVCEVSGGCLDGVWGLSGGYLRVWVMSE